MLTTNRWWLVPAAVCFQMSLGAAYAWSVFCTPLSKEFGWSITQVTYAFTIGWFFLGMAAVLGGLWLNHTTPRVVAMTGGLLWGAGVFLASFTQHRLWWLYLTYGAIGGTGLGMGYIVPISFLVKWFPDRRGLIVGLAVGGFGAGSLIAAPLAHHLIEHVGVAHTFAYLGIAYAIVSTVSALFMRNPPSNWTPAGWTPTAQQSLQRTNRDYTLGEALRNWQWWAICLFLSINTMAGLSLLSQAAPMFQELGKATSLAAAGLVGVISIGNGLGRVLWAWISDLTSRKTAYFLMYLIEAALFWSYPSISSLTLLAIVTGIVVTCYGGGYGITPAFAADYFGPRHVGPIYGFMLLPWAFASAFGPSLFAYLRQTTGSYTLGVRLIAGMMTLALGLPLLVSPPRVQTSDQEGLSS